MTYIDDWKKAKTAFETATNKKKPSETVLGIFRKGTGIEGACKALDAAKNIPDKAKAAKAFKTAYTNYVNLLNKTANDPKSIKKEDKSAYISAIISLKLALDAIDKEATGLAGREDTDAPPTTKTTSTPTTGGSQDALIKEAKAHIALREKVLKDATLLSSKMKSTVQMLNERLGLVQKQAVNAKAAAAKSDINGHKVAVSTIERFIDEAQGIAEKAHAAVDAFANPSGEFMDARGDMKATFDAISPPLGPQLKAARDKPWGPVSQMAAENITQVKSLEVVLSKMRAARAEASSHMGEGKSVKDHLTEILTLKASMGSLVKDLHVKSDRITKSLQEFDGKVAAYEKLPDAKTKKDTILKHCKLMEDQWKRYGPEMVTIRDRLVAMKTQATALSRDALEDKAIVKASTETARAADTGIADINKQLDDGKNLDRKIATTRAKYP